MALFKMDAFAHALNIFNLSKGQAPEEVIQEDHLPQQIANGRLDQINRNANADAFETMMENVRRERAKVSHLEGVSAMVSADRLALSATIEFIEKQ